MARKTPKPAASKAAEPESKKASQKPAAGGPSNRWVLAYCALLVVLAGVIYSPAVNGPFLLDDFDMTEPGSAIRSGNLRAIRASGRPLLMYTFRWNYLLAGFEPFGYHAVNIGLHALNALLLFGFLNALFARGRLNDLLRPDWQPLIRYGVPLLYLTTPVHSESVAYISSRSELFATTFYFAGLWLFASPLRERFRWPAAFALLILMGCAVLSKQDKITLPVALILMDYLLFARGDWRKMRVNWPLYSLFAAGVVAALALIVPFILSAPTVGFGQDWAQYLFTQFRVYPLYVRLMFAPVGLNADYGFTPSASLWEHFSWLGLLFLIAAGTGLLWIARKQPLIAFGGLLFFLALAPTSSIIPIADFAAERRLYIPAAGFFLAALAAVAQYAKASKSTVAVAVAGCALVYSGLTFQRSALWADGLALWQDTAEKSPNKGRPWTWLGLELNSRGQIPAAIAAWEKAEKLVEQGSQEHAHVLSNLGLAYANMKQYQRALDYYRRAVELSPGVVQFRAQLAVALMRLGREDEAWKAFEEAYQVNKFAPELYRLRGQELYQKDRFVEAERDFRAALEIRPEDTAARENLAAAREMLRRTGQKPWPGPLPNEGSNYVEWVAQQEAAGTLPH